MINLKITLIVVLMAGISDYSQSQTTTAWEKQFGTNKEEYVRNHIVDRSGNIYVSGNTQGTMSEINFGKTDGFIAKINRSGKMLWLKQFGSPEDEDVQWSATDSKANVYIVGTTTGVLDTKNFGKEDFFVVKYSPNGKKLWTKQFGSDSSDKATGICVSKEGYVYVTGSTMGKMGKSSHGNQDAFVMKLNKDGVPLYINQFGTPAYDGCNAITSDNYGSMFVVGTTFGKLGAENKGLIDYFIGQFTNKDTTLKYIQFGSEGFDIPTSILLDDEKNIYIGGTTSGNFACPQMGEGDCFLTKISKEGTLIWNKQFGTEKHDGIKGLAFNPKISDHILVSGLQNLPPAHAFVRMYKKDGNLLWEKNLIANGSKDDASGKDVSIDNKGNICHLGLTASNLFGTLIGVTDFYLIKMKLDYSFTNH
jgi:hypothetical protein